MVWDRCYRLRHNRCQVRVDRTATYGTLAGVAIAVATKASPANGFVISLPLSLIAAAFYNAKLAKDEPAVCKEETPASTEEPVTNK